MSLQLREWQQRGVDRFNRHIQTGDTDFMAACCPGAGKTIWALSIAQNLRRQNIIDLVVVVVPSDALRDQWGGNTSTALNLRPYSLRDVVVRKAGYDGVVTTYQALNGYTAGLLRREVNNRTLVILDEIHHAADSAAYGDNLRHAFDGAGFRLLLTGTPWRTRQRERIPFCTYDDITRELDVHHAYTYGEAVRDRVCRPIHFPIIPADVRWKYDADADVETVAMTADLDVDDKDRSAAMRTLLEPGGEWINRVLDNANTDLMSMRRDIPDAGGLVVARDQVHAHELAERLRAIVGTKPRVVVSDAADAKADIDGFRRSSEPWIVAVRMIAEGVDIPRLAVGVYATNYQTKMFFTQVVGRFVRKRDGENVTAIMYVPPHGVIRRFAEEIEQLAKHALPEDADDQGSAGQGGIGSGRQPSTIIPLGSTAHDLDRVIVSGESIGGADVIAAQEIFRQAGIPTHYAAQYAAVQHVQRPAAEPDRKPLNVIEKELRDEIKGLVGKVAYHCLEDHGAAKEVNVLLYRAFGISRAKAKVSTLSKMVDYLECWLEDGVQPEWGQIWAS